MSLAIDSNKLAVTRVFEEAFNAGDLSVVDELILKAGLDHQHPGEPDFTDHLKSVITAMRRAFPDLHFEITRMIGEGDWVALHSIMTGTHTGPLTPPLAPREIPATGKAIRVPHMHMIRLEAGNGAELLHLMDTFALMSQLGLLPPPR